MSHIANIKTPIRDLRALAAAARELGGELVIDQKTNNYYGGKNKCDHAIRISGVRYEVGVVKQKDGTFTLAVDDFGNDSASGHDGQRLTAAFGKGLSKLTQLYAVAKAEIEARARGWMSSRKTLANGSIKLTMTGMA